MCTYGFIVLILYRSSGSSKLILCLPSDAAGKSAKFGKIKIKIYVRQRPQSVRQHANCVRQQQQKLGKKKKVRQAVLCNSLTRCVRHRGDV